MTRSPLKERNMQSAEDCPHKCVVRGHSLAMEIPFQSGSEDETAKIRSSNLQEAFLRYRKERQVGYKWHINCLGK